MKTKLQMAGLAAAAVALLCWLAYDATRPEVPENDLSDGREYDRLVAVGIDLSGSFLHQMAEQGKAWDFLQKTLDRYLRGNGNEKLVLVQLSGNSQALLWDGTPAQLRRDFADREAFRRFLQSKADPSGSRLFDGITEAIDYVSGLPGVTARTKRALILLTDMEDNASAPGAEQRLVQALRGFGQRNGCVGIYFVSHPLVARWEANLRSAGVRHHSVESHIVTAPTLPSFD